MSEELRYGINNKISYFRKKIKKKIFDTSVLSDM